MRISIRDRIYWSFLILVMLFIINGVLTIITLNKSKKLSDNISTVIDPSQQAISDFKSLMIESKMYTTNWVFLRSNQEDKHALQQLHAVKYPALKVKLSYLFIKLDNKKMADSLKQIFNRFEHLLVTENQIMTSLKKFKDYDDPVKKLTAEQTIEDEILPRTATVMDLLDHVAAEDLKIKIREYKNQESYSEKLRISILLLAITIIFAGVFLSSYLTLNIIRPVNVIINMVKDLGEGKLTKVDLPVNKDEIGNMVLAVNNLSNKLHERALFASETGKKNFSVELTPLSDDDILGRALITMRDNLKVSEGELMHTVENLVQRNKELEQFTYIISHNLRAPVANIIGLTELLAVGADDEQESQKLISGLGKSVQKLDDVILDLNQILQVKQQVHEQTELVCFAQIMENISGLFNLYIEENVVEFKCNFNEVGCILSLKSYLYSIFYNLISNSIKFKRTDEKLLLEITSRKKNGKILIYFKDNGKGIDMKHNGDKLFGLYRRFDMSVEGKGMGLYMVKTQVETLGGQIKVQSKLDVGTMFTIELPENINSLN